VQGSLAVQRPLRAVEHPRQYNDDLETKLQSIYSRVNNRYEKFFLDYIYRPDYIVGVPTAPKGRRTVAPPLGSPATPYSAKNI